MNIKEVHYCRYYKRLSSLIFQNNGEYTGVMYCYKRKNKYSFETVHPEILDAFTELLESLKLPVPNIGTKSNLNGNGTYKRWYINNGYTFTMKLSEEVHNKLETYFRISGLITLEDEM